MTESPRKEISSRTGPDGARHTFALVLIIVLSLTTCAGTLNHELVRDDGSILQHVDSVVRGGGPQGLPGSRFAMHSGEGYLSWYYRHVFMAGLWLDSLRAVSFPWIFHFTNILLNLPNALLVFFLLRLLIGPFGAAAGSATFAPHPGRVEPLASVAGRTGLRAALVTLMGVIARVRERKSLFHAAGRSRLRGWFSFSIACLYKQAALLGARPEVDPRSPGGARGHGSGTGPKTDGTVFNC